MLHTLGNSSISIRISSSLEQKFLLSIKLDPIDYSFLTFRLCSYLGNFQAMKRKSYVLLDRSYKPENQHSRGRNKNSESKVSQAYVLNIGLVAIQKETLSQNKANTFLINSIYPTRSIMQAFREGNPATDLSICDDYELDQRTSW